MKVRVLCPLGLVTVDAEAREVWCDGELVVLAPQVFDCIQYLLAHRDRAVGRDELIAGVWGRAEITDTLLHQTVMRVRRVFGDSGDEQQVLRTIPRFGYRWIAEVEETVSIASDDKAPAADTTVEELAQTPSPPFATTPPAPPATTDRGRRWSGWIGTLSVLILLIALAVWWWFPRGVDGGDAAAERAQHPGALVVLPVDISGGRDAAWMPLGVMDALASYLREGGLSVVPSQTVMGLLDAHIADKQDLAGWQQATGASRLLLAHALARGEVWQVSLTLHGIDGSELQATGTASDVLGAARLASEALLAAVFPVRLQGAVGGDQDADLALVLQRAQADILANRLDAARDLLDSVAIELRSNPRLRLMRAEIDYRSGRMDAARAQYIPLLQELSVEAQPLLRAQALIGLASVERTAGDMQAASQGYSQAIDLLEPLQEPIQLGQAHVYRGVALGSLGEFEAAQQDIARGRVLLGGAGDAYGVAMADAALATLNADRGRLVTGSGQLAKAVVQFERLGAMDQATAFRLALAQMHIELLEHSAALEQAERVWRSTGAQAGHRLRFMAGVTYAHALIGNGRLAEARRVLAELEDPRVAHDYQWRSLRGVASALALLDGNAERAERLAAEVLDGAESHAEPDVDGLWLTWFRALRVQDKMRAAHDGLARLDDWSTQVRGKVAAAQLYAALIRGEQAWGERRLEDSRREYASALRQAGELGVPQDIARVVQSYGTALIADGALDEAVAVVGQVAAWADSDFDCAVVTARLHRALGHRSAWQDAVTAARRLAGERAIPAAIERFQDR